MYYDYFGLTESPFSIAPNPEYLLMTERHKEALAHLYHGIEHDSGFVLLTGDVGTGKTTVCRSFMEKLPDETDIAFILNPFLNGRELLFNLCEELNITGIPQNSTLRQLTNYIYRYLLANHAKGRQTALLIDEAQHLSFKVLELIRLLTNLETNTHKLLKIILVGQPELTTTLNKPELVQLSQRVTTRYHIKPLNLAETSAYIDYRLRMAGYVSEKKLFSGAIAKSIYKSTGGVPRLINVICDRALLGTYSQSRSAVDRSTLKKAIVEVNGKHQLKPQPSLVWPSIIAATLFVGIGIGALTLAYWQAPAPIESLLQLTLKAKDQTEESITEVKSDENITSPVAADKSTPVQVDSPLEQDTSNNHPQNTVEPAPLQWQQYSSLEQAMDRLIPAVRKDTSLVKENCQLLESVGWQCRKTKVDDWQLLRSYNRPAVLTMETDNNERYFLPVIGISNTHLTILNDKQSKAIALNALAPIWTGEFAYLWQPPEGFKEYIYFDSNAELVDWLANAFAIIDNRDEPLAGKKFTSLLKQRVMLFQREKQLVEDGIAGVRTLLKINEELKRAVTLGEFGLDKSVANTTAIESTIN